MTIKKWKQPSTRKKYSSFCDIAIAFMEKRRKSNFKKTEAPGNCSLPPHANIQIYHTCEHEHVCINIHIQNDLHYMNIQHYTVHVIFERFENIWTCWLSSTARTFGDYYHRFGGGLAGSSAQKIRVTMVWSLCALSIALWQKTSTQENRWTCHQSCVCVRFLAFPKECPPWNPVNLHVPESHYCSI